MDDLLGVGVLVVSLTSLQCRLALLSLRACELVHGSSANGLTMLVTCLPSQCISQACGGDVHGLVRHITHFGMTAVMQTVVGRSRCGRGDCSGASSDLQGQSS